MKKKEIEFLIENGSNVRVEFSDRRNYSDFVVFVDGEKKIEAKPDETEYQTPLDDKELSVSIKKKFFINHFSVYYGKGQEWTFPMMSMAFWWIFLAFFYLNIALLAISAFVAPDSLEMDGFPIDPMAYLFLTGIILAWVLGIHLAKSLFFLRFMVVSSLMGFVAYIVMGISGMLTLVWSDFISLPVQILIPALALAPLRFLRDQKRLKKEDQKS